MSDSKFPNLIDYHALKAQFKEQQIDSSKNIQDQIIDAAKTQITQVENFEQDSEVDSKVQGLTGTRLRSYAFAVLTRKEYSKVDLIAKLMLYAQSREEVINLVEELSKEHYQSDQRVAEMTVRSQVRKGKGPNRIKLALKTKHLDKALVQEDLAEIDWYEQAYQLKVKKYGAEVAKDPKIKAKQIRFLQYRGFEMDAIMKAISRKEDDFE